MRFTNGDPPVQTSLNYPERTGSKARHHSVHIYYCYVLDSPCLSLCLSLMLTLKQMIPCNAKELLVLLIPTVEQHPSLQPYEDFQPFFISLFGLLYLLSMIS